MGGIFNTCFGETRNAFSILEGLKGKDHIVGGREVSIYWK
jgi:hypothetical protein